MEDKETDIEIQTPEEETQEPTPEMKTDEDDGALKLTASQFVRAMGFRWERSSGFVFEQGKLLGKDVKFKVSEWKPRWEAFLKRPVK